MDLSMENMNYYLKKGIQKDPEKTMEKMAKIRGRNEVFALVIEECSELIQRITKMMRTDTSEGRDDSNILALIEEFTDVQNALELLGYALGLRRNHEQLLWNMRIIKGARLEERLEEFEQMDYASKQKAKLEHELECMKGE